MRKFFSLLVGSILFFSCQKSQAPVASDEDGAIKRTCATDEVLKAQLAEDPTLADRMNSIEAFTQRLLLSGNLRTTGTIEIPVVVHIIYNAAVENISDAQVASQIDVLNEDYNLKNADNTQVPSLFSNLKA